jgi:hypothetical protein
MPLLSLACFLVLWTVRAADVRRTRQTAPEEEPAEGAGLLSRGSIHAMASAKEAERMSEEEALALVDRNDPCAAHTSCGQCSLDQRCGWCAANSACQMGGPSGPKPPAVCVTWSKGFCETSKCGDYTHCTSCLADPYCGWCAAPTDDPSEAQSGACMEGGSGGPGDAEGECPDTWKHSPIRKGTAYAFASKLALTHAPYLREVCEAADGKIPYAPAPPTKPLPAKKPPVVLDVRPRDGPVFGGTHITLTGLWFGHEKSDQVVTLGGRPCAETLWKSQSVIVCVTERAPRAEAAHDLPLVVHFDGMQSSPMGNSGRTLPVDQPEEGEENGTPSSPPQPSSMPGDVAKFSYLDVEVDEIHPAVGKTEGGTIVSIRGRNFGRHDFGPTVKFGDRECVAVQWESAELIKCATAPGWGTNFALDLTIMGVNPVTVPPTFSYLPPAIESIVPGLARTAGNTSVVVSGSNFGTRDVVPVITIGGTPCISQTWVTHSRIDCTVPPGVGTGHVVRATVDVRTSEGEDVTLSYLSPVIASVQPDHGPTTGGYAVLISGTDFGSGAYEPSLTFQPAKWQRDVLAFGSPKTKLHGDLAAARAKLDEDQAHENRTVTTANMVPLNMSGGRAAWNTTRLVRAGIPDIVSQDTDVRNMIMEAAVKASAGDSKDATAAIANATMAAVGKLNDTQGIGQTIAAVAAAAVETIAGVGKSTRVATGKEDSEQAAADVLNTLVGEEKENRSQEQAGTFLEVEEIVDGQDIDQKIMPLSGAAENTTNNTLASRVQDVRDQDALLAAQSRCTPEEAVDYTARGPRCLRIMIDGRSCLGVTMVSDQLARCIVPEGIGKNLSVSVVTGGQTSMSTEGAERLQRLRDSALPKDALISDTDQYRYSAPVVTFMYPDSGPAQGGYVLTVKGRNFGTRDWGNGTVLMTVGGQPCMETTWLSDGVMECLVPKGVGAKQLVEVTVGGQTYPPPGSDTPLLFSYAPPIVLDVQPRNGPTAGAFDITITGRNFGRMKHKPQPFIGGVPCTDVRWISDSVLTCKAPEGHGVDKSVVVWVGEQHSKLDNAMFKYDRPIVTEITPNHCRTIGECLVRIKGANFGHEQGQHIRVEIGGILCADVGRGDQPQWMSHTEMECVVPPGVGQDLDVKVEVAEQTSLPNALFHYDNANIFGMRPNHGDVGGGQPITLLGQNFGTEYFMDPEKDEARGGKPAHTIRVYFGDKISDNECVDAKWISDSEVSCITPAGYGGDVMPHIEIRNEYSVDSEILDLGKVAALERDADEAYAESDQRKEEGDQEMQDIYREKGDAIKEKESQLFAHAQGILFLNNPPEIHSVSLTHGPTRGGSEVVVKGLNFAEDAEVVFSDMSAVTSRTSPGLEPSTAWLRATVPCKNTKRRSVNELVCTTPGGIGPGHMVHVRTGGRIYVQKNVSAIRTILKCPPPPAIKRGQRNGDWEFVGASIAYSCNQNHTMHGEAVLTCNEKGEWSPPSAPLCKPPPEPVPTPMHGLNASTDDVQPEEDVEPEEIKVVTTLQRLTGEKEEAETKLHEAQDRDQEVKELAEESYKAEQKKVKATHEATKRAEMVANSASDAVKQQMDNAAKREGEELRKRKEAEDAEASAIEESRKAKEADIQKRAAAEALIPEGGEGSEPGSPGAGLVAAKPSPEEQAEAIELAKDEEEVESKMAALAKMLSQTWVSQREEKEARTAVETTKQALEEAEAALEKGNAEGVPAAVLTELTQKRDSAATAAEDAKKALTKAGLSVTSTKEEFGKAAADPQIHTARIKQAQIGATTAEHKATEISVAAARAQNEADVAEGKIDLARKNSASSAEMASLQEAFEEAKAAATQAADAKNRADAEAEAAKKALETIKQQEAGEGAEQLMKEAQDGSAIDQDADDDRAPIDDQARSALKEQVETNKNLDDETKEASVQALGMASDMAVAAAILNAAPAGADAVREASTTPPATTRVYSMSEDSFHYKMVHPGYPDKDEWEIFAVRIADGAGLMDASVAHAACRSFGGDTQLVTHEIAQAGRIAGFHRCTPSWIERFGQDLPTQGEAEEKCRVTSVEQGQCPAGTDREDTDGGNVVCTHRCPKASAVILGGNAGCPTNLGPPCPPFMTEAQGGTCMTEPGTIPMHVVMAHALCTRPATTAEPAVAVEAGVKSSAVALLEMWSGITRQKRRVRHHVEVNVGLDGDTARRRPKRKIKCLIAYNVTTGREAARYYDLHSKKGRSLDPSTNYIASGDMILEPRFDYDPPVVSSVAMSNGPAAGGTEITVTGYNFGPVDALTGDKIRVWFDIIDGRDGKSWVPCRSTTWVSDTTAKCTIPAGVGKNQKIRGTLATLTGEMSQPGFSFDAPVVERVEPNHGPPRGGYTVTLYGRNFGTVRSTWHQKDTSKTVSEDGKVTPAETKSMITIGGRNCLKTKWISDSAVECKVPPGWSEKRGVRVTGVARQGSQPKPLFHYDRPVVTDVTPAHSGTVVPEKWPDVLIKGDNFGECGEDRNGNEYCPDPKAFVNGYPCQNTTRVSHKSIRCKLPHGVGGNLRVMVILGNLDSKENELFSYHVPSIVSVEPKHGPAVGGNLVTVKGKNFGHKAGASLCTGAARSSCFTGKCCRDIREPFVSINGIQCGKTEWVGDEEMRCTVNPKPGVGFRLSITATVGEVPTTVLDEMVRYTIDPPFIASVAPQVLPRGGGSLALKGNPQKWVNNAATITIKGKNFGTTKSEIQAGFDDARCSKVQWIDDETIKCTLALPVRDGFEDRTAWAIVGKQESYSPARAETIVEFRRTDVYREYERFRFNGDVSNSNSAGPHLFVVPEMTLKECQVKCTNMAGGRCVAITRPANVAPTAPGKCEGWSRAHIKTCVKDTGVKANTAWISETVKTTEIGVCHAKTTIRFGPMVTSVDRAQIPKDGGGLLTLTGFNFGAFGTEKAKSAVAFVDDFPCLSTKVLSDTTMECIAPPNEFSMRGPVTVLDDHFESFKGTVNVADTQLHPLRWDVLSTTAKPGLACGSDAQNPGGSLVMPATGAKVAQTAPVLMGVAAQGKVRFSLRVGRGDTCGASVRSRQDLEGISIALQASDFFDSADGGSWRTIKEWRLDSSSPNFFNNRWASLDAPVAPRPASSGGRTGRSRSGVTAFRWIQTGRKASAALIWAIDDVRIEHGGGAAPIHVEVDYTRSAFVPLGTDYEGKPAPNSVTVTYVGDEMQDTGSRIASVTAPALNIPASGPKGPGWTGVFERHVYCTRNFASSKTATMDECEATCDRTEHCNMFSWGYVDAAYLREPNRRITRDQQGKQTGVIHPDCRVSTNPDATRGCYPEPAATRGVNPLEMPSRAPIFVRRAAAGENPALGGFLHRVATHDIFPATGGLFGAAAALAKPKSTSSDIAFAGKDSPISVALTAPVVAQKVIVRASTGVSADDGCAVKTVVLSFSGAGDRTTTVDIPEMVPGKTDNNGRESPAGGFYAVAEVQPLSSVLGLPVTQGYEVRVTQTRGKCDQDGGTLRLRAVEVRGQVLRAPLPKTQAWIDDRNFVSEFAEEEAVFAVALRQNPFNRARKIRLTAGALNLERTLSNNEEAQLVSLPGVGTTGAAAEKVTIEVLSTWDKVSTGAGQILDEDFRTAQFDRKLWHMPALRGADSIQYGYDASRPKAPFYFIGDAMKRRPVRSKVLFPVMNTEIKVGLVRGHACSDHFIALSPDENYKFSLGAEARTLKFAYNCDSKYLYGHLKPGSSPHQKLQQARNIECKFDAASGNQVEEWKITITSDTATFSGGSPGCGDLSMPITDFNKAAGGQFYLYFGAASDNLEKRSYFDSLKVQVKSDGLKELTILTR